MTGPGRRRLPEARAGPRHVRVGPVASPLVAYERDILGEPLRQPRTFPRLEAVLGIVVEDRGSGFCGDVVKHSIEAVTLRDRHGSHRHFRWKEGGFLHEGRAVTLVRPAVTAAGPKLTASGSIAGPTSNAKIAEASRIWVEGKHDAELVEQVWGDDLRELAIVVEPMGGIDDLVTAVARFGPGPTRRLGILVDHLVAGSKETRLTSLVRDPNVLITGHPFVDVWAAVYPRVIGETAWPDVPKGRPWKDGVCAALGVTDPLAFWPRLRNRVRSYADLRPELVGAVEQLLDFVSDTGEG